MALPLPPGVDDAQFRAAMQKMAEAIGSQWVYTEEDDVMLYRDAYSPAWDEPEELLPSAAVAPASTEEVQKIVRIANEYRVPLYPVSTGKNLGYGGSAPNMTGTVVLDLKRMNRVIAVDDKRHFAIVEPGVSYFDLYRHIRENKLKVWIDCPDPGWGGVLGNALDRGIGYTLGIYRDHWQAHCGLEVVLPNGELMRTGMGALPGAKTFAEYRYGFGPYVDGLFSQGNFGIVTQMGIRLMPEPERFIGGQIRVPRRRDLIPLVDIVNELENSFQVGAPFFGSPLYALSFLDPEVRKIGFDYSLTDDQLDAVAAKRGLPFWKVDLPIYGPAPVAEAVWTHIQDRVRQLIPEASFEKTMDYRFPLTDEQARAMPHKVQIGVPGLEIFSVGARSDYNPHPTDGHMWFASVLPRSGEAVFEAQKVFAEASRELGVDPIFPNYFPPMGFLSNAFMYINFLPISKSDPDRNKATRETFRYYVTAAGKAGYGEYRAPPLFHDLVSDIYSFNDHALRRFTQTMKDAVDPNGIIAPGRGGIWPARYRGAKP
ncbi:FAD-binding oxidoreductase [Paracoccus yeei]|uniref:FAD-binding oxidoreductase n=1 Tax=Paracoccus yeei TaxID=147645 RepID=A0A5P2QYB8_9RHOB|nr:FAD-binding oxidoreductase [Paracoccus yeei]MBY0138063.1 FAD-binding oxidoreductase [Paracoccus yeei]QEU10313.1 FAD-binding oxidoreductase [Paracoccus yeei]